MATVPLNTAQAEFAVGTAITRRTTDTLYTLPVAARLYDQSLRAAAQRNRYVEVHDPTYQGSVTSYTRGADFKAAQDVTQGNLTLTMDQYREQGDQLTFIDIQEATISHAERMSRNQDLKMALNADDYLIKGLVSAATANTALSFTTTLTGSDRLTTTWPYYSNNVGRASIRSTIRRAYHTAFTQNWVNGPSLDGGPNGVWALCHPDTVSILMEDMLDQKYSWDSLTSRLLTGATMPGGASPYQGTLHNIEVMTSNQFPRPTLDGSQAANRVEHQIVFGTRRARSYAMRPTFVQVISPARNQAGPHLVVRKIAIWGAMTLNEDQIFKGTISTIVS